MNNKLSAAARREENWGWFMVAPTIIGLVVLNLWPFVQTLYASFCEHEGFGHYKFIGLQNYVDMFTNAEFWKATWNTIYFCILTVPVGIALALLIAMLLNANVRFKGGFRTIFSCLWSVPRKPLPWCGVGSSTVCMVFLTRYWG